VGHPSYHPIVRSIIIYLCNKLAIDVRIDRMLLCYDGQLVGVIESPLDCSARARSKDLGLIAQIIGSVWTDMEAVLSILMARSVKNEASTSPTLNESHICLHGEIAHEEFLW